MSDAIINQLSTIPDLQLEPIEGNVSYIKVSPLNVEALSQVTKTAYKHKWTIIPSGKGSKLNWGGIVKTAQILISTEYLNQIIDYAVSDLSVTVGSGVLLKDLQQELAKHNQLLPIDPAYPHLATLGGIVATGDTGSYRRGYGGVRDLVLGLSWVRSDGEVTKAGGKVVKNVAGYDMMKLLTGSYGTLGIMTSITFRLYPIAKDSLTVLVTGQASKINALSQTITQSSLTPTMADLISESLVRHLGLGDGLGLIMRFQTIPESINAQIAKIKETGTEMTIYQGDKENNLWQALKQTIREVTAKSDITCKIGIKASQATSLLTFLDSMSVLAQIHLSSGVGYLKLDREDILPQLRSYLEAEKGFLSVLEASPECKAVFEPWGYTGNALEMMRKIKQQFDPYNLLSPGRFLGNI